MFILFLTKNTFKKIFTNLSREFDAPPENIQLGIQYKNGSHNYEAYKNFQKEKDIELNDYVGSSIGFDLTGGVSSIDMVIGESGVRYANELNCKTDDIKIIMAYKEKELPRAALLQNNKKVREIDIQKEFFS